MLVLREATNDVERICGLLRAIGLSSDGVLTTGSRY